jgi:hypothetical protein
VTIKRRQKAEHDKADLHANEKSLLKRKSEKNSHQNNDKIGTQAAKQKPPHPRRS